MIIHSVCLPFATTLQVIILPAHLHKNLSEIRERKEQVSKQLSGEERELQIDIDWLETFHDRLEHIQRG